MPGVVVVVVRLEPIRLEVEQVVTVEAASVLLVVVVAGVGTTGRC